MIIEQLSLANFRGFEQFDLTFDPKVTVVAGVNGVGKSGILHALTVLFSRSLPEFTPSASKPLLFTDDDVQNGKPSLETSAIFTVADQKCHINVQRVKADAAGGDKSLLLLENVKTEFSRTGNLDAAWAETQRVLRALRDRPAQPVVIFFSPRRQLPGRPKTLPKPSPFAPKEAYKFALDDRDVTLREFMHWFRAQESLAEPDAMIRINVLDRLKQVVTTFIPEFTGLRIETSPLRMLVDKGNIPLMLNQLSDGERGMLAILFDITRRLAIANPNSADPVAEGEAIVLIDEIELHLHPLWQKRVLKRFADTFARCQFIVTSHSPLVLGEVEGEAIRFLYRDQGRVMSWTPKHARGLDFNRILEDLMGVESRDPETVAKLHQLAQAIDREEFEQARDMIAQLQEQIGDDADLVRSKALMAFLEGKE
jgi:predicted ATP-binding protein involved in virulence